MEFAAKVSFRGCPKVTKSDKSDEMTVLLILDKSDKSDGIRLSFREDQQ